MTGCAAAGPEASPGSGVRHLRRGAVLGGWALASAALWAAEVPLTTLAGELSGEIRPLQLAGAPTLRWKVSLQAGGDGPQQAGMTVEGPGTEMEAELAMDSAGDTRWRLVSARVDLAAWAAGIFARYTTDFATATMAGILTAAGDGSWREGELAGNARFILEDGRIDSPPQKLRLEGVALDVLFEDLAARRSAKGQVLTWTGGHFDEIELGPGRVAFALAGDEMRVEEATIAMFGGEVKLASFAFSLTRLEMSVIARVVGIDVARLLPLLPPVLADARGRLDGSLTLRRDSSGIQIGAGRLALQPGRPAELRLEPTPGLLSRSLPSTVLKYYPGLTKIETGEIPIRASLLEVAFTPGGDAEGRTAYIHLTGGPDDPNFRAPIDLEVNVRGPLESLVKLGTSGRLRFGAP